MVRFFKHIDKNYGFAIIDLQINFSRKVIISQPNRPWEKGQKEGRMYESFKKDVLAIACGIVIGCVLIHHSGWRLASWLLWTIGVIGGAASAYILRLAFEPKRITLAAGHAWQKARQLKLKWPKKPKWGWDKKTSFGAAKSLIVLAAGLSWSMILMSLFVSQTNPGPRSTIGIIDILIICGILHFLHFWVFIFSGFTVKGEDEPSITKTSTALKWNFISMPFSLFYYVVIIFIFKMVIGNILKFGWKFFILFAKFVHSSIATSCATYAAIFTLITAAITGNIFFIIALAIAGGLIGAVMRRLVPKLCHWQYPQAVNT
jgi:hypothetical protein